MIGRARFDNNHKLRKLHARRSIDVKEDAVVVDDDVYYVYMSERENDGGRCR